MQRKNVEGLPDDRPGAYNWKPVVGVVILAVLIGLGVRLMVM